MFARQTLSLESVITESVKRHRIILFSVVSNLLVAVSINHNILCVVQINFSHPCCNQPAPPCLVQLLRLCPQDADICILLIQKSWGYQEAAQIMRLHTCLTPFM